MVDYGRLCEDIAVRLLLRRGYRLIGRNWHCRYGEIDILMSDGTELVFVEVKGRAGTRFGPAIMGIGNQKKRRLARAMAAYMNARNFNGEFRLDLVFVDVNANTKRGRISVLKHADIGLCLL